MLTPGNPATQERVVPSASVPAQALTAGPVKDNLHRTAGGGGYGGAVGRPSGRAPWVTGPPPGGGPSPPPPFFPFPPPINFPRRASPSRRPSGPLGSQPPLA